CMSSGTTQNAVLFGLMENENIGKMVVPSKGDVSTERSFLKINIPKEAMNLKESKKWYMGNDVIIISKIK
ncbi:hypothetical protein ACQP3F_29035, partial [Escherichia coli]